MDNDKPQKIDIGFLGGPVLVARVAPSKVAELRRSLGKAIWHELEAEDGTIALDLEKVVYVLVESEDQRVGFGV
jgi:hypothetical protein